MQKVFYIPIVLAVSLISSCFVLFLVRLQLKDLIFSFGIFYTNSCTQLFFPTNLDDLKILSDNLIKCYNNQMTPIHIFHAICFLFLQTWCIPGTVLFNLFGGAVFGVYKGTMICLMLNVLGASFSFLLSRYFLCDFFERNEFLKKNKEKLKVLVDKNRDNLVYYMIFLRLFPGSPNWLMNISFPHLNISLIKFALTVMVGIAPWNFFSCSAGAILRELTNTKEIMDSRKYLMLLGLALCFLIIPILKSRFNSKNERESEKQN